MKKDTTNTLLLIGAGALAAYLLLPKVQEVVSGAIPEFPSIDLSKLFPEGGVPLTFEYPEMDFAGAISDALSGVLGDLGIIIPAKPEDVDVTIPPVPPIPTPVTEKGWWDIVKTEAVKVAEYGAIVGASYVGLRYAGPPVARAAGTAVERVASRLFAARTVTKAVPGVKVGEMGVEALGKAAATKGFPLRYPGPAFRLPIWLSKLFRFGGMRFMGLAPAIILPSERVAAPTFGTTGIWGRSWAQPWYSPPQVEIGGSIFPQYLPPEHLAVISEGLSRAGFGGGGGGGGGRTVGTATGTFTVRPINPSTGKPMTDVEWYSLGG